MKVPEESQGIDAFLLSFLEKAPVLSRYAKTRGWYYVVSWLQRYTGIGLVIILIVYLYLLSSVRTPGVTYDRVNIFAGPIFTFFIWVSSLIVGFHALNGGRLILYELFGKRNDAAMIRWTFGLTIAYALLFGFSLAMNNRGVPVVFFGWAVFLGGVVMAYTVAFRIGKSRHSVIWKLQRISGAFLFITAPAYLLFSHLSPGVAGDAQAALAPLQNQVIRIVMLALAILALYHAGYGLFSIAADYVSSRTVRGGITALIVVVTVALAALAFRLLLCVS